MGTEAGSTSGLCRRGSGCQPGPVLHSSTPSACPESQFIYRPCCHLLSAFHTEASTEALSQEHVWGLCAPPLLRKGDSLACGGNIKAVQVHTDVVQQDKWVPSRAQRVQRGAGCSGHTAACSQIPPWPLRCPPEDPPAALPGWHLCPAPTSLTHSIQ